MQLPGSYGKVWKHRGCQGPLLRAWLLKILVQHRCSWELGGSAPAPVREGETEGDLRPAGKFLR